MIVQIYAFTNPKDAVEAAKIGVDHVGFVAGDYGQVCGELSLSEAAAIAGAVREICTSVALTMATNIDEILTMAAAVKPDIVHVSTDPLDVDVQAMRELRDSLSPHTRLMKALPVDGTESVTLAKAFATTCDYLLLDTKVAGMPGVGATGMTHDWGVSRRIVQSVSCPVILAGGLSSANVVQAIKAVDPWGVDSNTATNVPGDKVRKDMERLSEFCEVVRSGAV